MNAFEQYAAEKAPVIPDSRANRRKKNPSALDLKMEEKQRLTKAYLATRRARRAELLEQEPRLRDLIKYLRKLGPEDGDELIEAVRESWLMRASQEIRLFALELVGRCESRIKLAIGLVPLDDPVPPETSVFFEVQGLLRKAGPL